MEVKLIICTACGLRRLRPATRYMIKTFGSKKAEPLDACDIHAKLLKRLGFLANGSGHPHKCPGCARSFKSPGWLRNHIKRTKHHA